MLLKSANEMGIEVMAIDVTEMIERESIESTLNDIDW